MTAGARKILIVDDDTDFVEAVSSYMEANDYSVLKAYNGQDGLRLAKMVHPDLIIMDIMMTERTEGFFAIQEIRRTPELETVPVIVLSSLWSGVTDFQVVPERGWLAHDKFIAKPVDLPYLLQEIRLCMGDNERVGEAAANEGAEA